MDDGLAPPPSTAGKHFIRMDGQRVLRAAVGGFCEAIEQTAAANGMEVDDFDWIVPQQANGRIFYNVANHLRIPLHRFCLKLAEYGNTSPASIPLALNGFDRQWTGRAGSRLMLASVGAGITAAGAALFID